MDVDTSQVSKFATSSSQTIWCASFSLDKLFACVTALFFVLLLTWCGNVLLASLERASLFTLYFHLTYHWHLWRSCLAVIFAGACFRGLLELAALGVIPGSIVALVLGLLCTGVYSYVTPAWADVQYMRTRWAAWSGMSRTAIAPPLVQHLPQTKEGWENMASEYPVKMNSVEKVPAWWIFRARGIRADPTRLLLAKARAGSIYPQERSPNAASWPSGSFPVNIYRPIVPLTAASLLWGEQISFSRRVSQAIISLPRAYLSSSPSLPRGVPAHGLVLAFGILARNKGLAPATLVCNLTSHPSALRAFEEYSVWYPRPAKTLRSYFRQEIESAFGILGPAYVSAATELALILVDVPPAIVLEWLGHNLEHQDLALNIRAEKLGATAEELARLYRGHYAAMLVSLNRYQGGQGLRPEMLVFDVMCRREGAEIPGWAMGEEMVERRRRELVWCGGQEIAENLVMAVV
ncbi:hypothetical protein EV426DRAFT_608894 [Tirmania nivea]|nr:hypothetical protein EV426DRAFT_608894 [Tirmania nivea]